MCLAKVAFIKIIIHKCIKTVFGAVLKTFQGPRTILLKCCHAAQCILQGMVGMEMAKQTDSKQKSTGKAETRICRGLSDSKSHGCLVDQTMLFGFGCKAIRKGDCAFCVTTLQSFNI